MWTCLPEDFWERIEFRWDARLAGLLRKRLRRSRLGLDEEQIGQVLEAAEKAITNWRIGCYMDTGKDPLGAALPVHEGEPSQRNLNDEAARIAKACEALAGRLETMPLQLSSFAWQAWFLRFRSEPPSHVREPARVAAILRDLALVFGHCIPHEFPAPGRGRPRSEKSILVHHLASAWYDVTGRKPNPHRKSPFVAVAVAALSAVSRRAPARLEAVEDFELAADRFRKAISAGVSAWRTLQENVAG